MSLGLRLDLRQTQGLVMTPQLQQAIKLLQLTNVELAAFVDQELERNPFLEQDEAGDALELPPEALPSGEAAGQEPDPEIEHAAERADADDGWLEPVAAPAADSHIAPARGAVGADDDRRSLEETLSRAPSLREHLLAQLQVDVAEPRLRLIGAHLIDLVDEAGYVRGDLEEVALRLGCSVTEVETVLSMLQRLDPPGVCARSLPECLAIQLRERDRLDPAMQALLDHLDLLAKGDIAGLLRVTGVDDDDLAEMIQELKALDPRPGLAFAADEVDNVIPDILVSAHGSDFRVELNAQTLPRVLVNSAYYADISRGARDAGARAFMSERFQTASWLAKALDQRARTLLRVAEAIVERQQEFLRHGVSRLRPLGLKDIALATGLHESTVSRAVADKWAATPRGTLPLRYFFTNAVGDGEAAHAAEAIRQQIRRLVEREPPDAVLSDDQIVERLAREGVSIARRTVAKYRESLGIASSVERRRQKALWLA